MAKTFTDTASEIVQLLELKNQLYGSDNLKEFGLLGVVVRLSDKLNRLKHQILHPEHEDPETIEDTLKDIAGYAILALTKYRNGELSSRGALLEK